MITIEELVREICTFIGKNASREPFYGGPAAYTIEPFSLLDRIHAVTGISKDLMGEFVDAAIDEREQ